MRVCVWNGYVCGMGMCMCMCVCACVCVCVVVVVVGAWGQLCDIGSYTVVAFRPNSAQDNPEPALNHHRLYVFILAEFVGQLHDY